jgi:hypothetical protein
MNANHQPQAIGEASQSEEFLVVDAVRALDLAIQMRGPGTHVHVPDIRRLEIPVVLRLEPSPTCSALVIASPVQAPLRPDK